MPDKKPINSHCGRFAILLAIVFSSMIGLSVYAACPRGVAPCYQTCYDCVSGTDGCGATLQQWKCNDTCCGLPDYLVGESTAEIWQHCDALIGANYADQSCLKLNPNLPKNPNNSNNPVAPSSQGATNGCAHVGETCAANGDCCSLICASKKCQNVDSKAATTCKAIKDNCASNSECCSTICTMGKCTYSDGSDTPGPSNGDLANVMQPSVLNWTINSYPDLGLYDSSGKKKSMTIEPYGVSSFEFQIDNPDNQIFEPQNVPKSTYDKANKTFSKCLDHEYFNTRTDGKICFLNSAKTVTYRVKACCHTDCTDCGPYVTWTMTTGQAPELAGITDKNITTPAADPDWTGPLATTNADLESVTFNWCAATVPPPNIPLNQGQTNALSYQVMLYSDEQQAINLNNSYVAPKFTQYADWLKIDKLGYGPQETCNYMEKEADGTCKAEVVNPTSGLQARLYFSNSLNPNNDKDLITKNVTYDWQVRPCYNNPNASLDSCQSTSIQNYGEKWKLTAAQTPLAAPQATTPPDDQNSADSATAVPVGLPPDMSWKQPSGANSYEYQVQEYDGTKYQDLLKAPQPTVNTQVLLSKVSTDTPNADVIPLDADLNSAYRWRVRSCWPSLPLDPSKDCNEAWSSWYQFRTTGRAPKTESMQPADNSAQVPLPVTLKWEHVPGAVSYLLTVNGKSIPVTKSANDDPVTFQLTYPAVTQNQVYKWNIETCADASASNCGVVSDTLTFGTTALGTAANAQQPQDGQTLRSQDLGLTNIFSWDQVPGAQYYRFSLTYADKSSLEKNQDCAVGEKVNTLAAQNSIAVDNSTQGIYCLGNYTWNVQACMDQNCKDTGPVSANWTFTLTPGATAKKGSGFMVCGQADDNPNTPYDEREACSAKHLFLVLEKIINFVLFDLAFWLLPVLGVITAVIFYKSLGGPEVWETVKSWWRAIGIGYALLFFAWIIVGVMLRIFGYTSVWWKI